MSGESLFIVVSGLPGSGKTTLGRQLARALGLPLIDKDEILAGLFETKGIGDAEWRRGLSRESDAILQAEAKASAGAVLVSHWQRRGMEALSGTPVEWLRSLPGRLIHVRCVCPPALAAERFVNRGRHPGHLDAARSASEIRASIEQVAVTPALEIKPMIDVDTSSGVVMEDVLRLLRPWC